MTTKTKTKPPATKKSKSRRPTPKPVAKKKSLSRRSTVIPAAKPEPKVEPITAPELSFAQQWFLETGNKALRLLDDSTLNDLAAAAQVRLYDLTGRFLRNGPNSRNNP